MAVVFATQQVGGNPVLASRDAGGTDHSLTASNIAGTAPTLGSPALAQNHVVTASGNIIASSPALGTPALVLVADHALLASGLYSSEPVLGMPAITALQPPGTIVVDPRYLARTTGRRFTART